MDAQFWTVLGTATITLTATYLAYWLAGKPRLIVFSPNSTHFELKPSQQGSPPIAIRAGQIIVQNSGRKSATEIQLVAAPGPHPWGYNIVPAVDHTVRAGARGEWVLELKYLGPSEHITLQILNGPQIESIRSKEGAAKAVPVIHQRLFPRWVGVTMIAFALVGLVTLIYGVITLAMRFF